MTDDLSNVGLVMDAADNVATFPWGGQRGMDARLRGSDISLRLAADIPPGHKGALRPIPQGQQVTKYGSVIGVARSDIAAGAHVHVENVRSRFSPTEPAPEDEVVARIRPDRLENAITRVLLSEGLPEGMARDVAAHVALAEASGVGTHGIRRLPPLLTRLRAGGIGTEPPELDRAGAVVRIDGCSGPGQHVARVAADAAVDAARDHGVGVALVRNSSHFGFAGAYAAMIARQGFVGVAISNGQVLVGPEGSKRAIFSNDPIAVAAPMGDGDIFEFDMATSVTSRAVIAEAAERGVDIPRGIALDQDGAPTTDARAALEGILLPFGGAKGFGLIAALEVLAGVLPGGAYADDVVSKEAAADAPEGTSHFIMAIAPAGEGGEPAFRARLADLAARVADLPMRSGTPPARLPGARRTAIRATAAREGIPVDRPRYDILTRIVAEAGLSIDLAGTT